MGRTSGTKEVIAILFVVVAIVLAVLSFGGLVVGFALGILMGSKSCSGSPP